SSSELCRAFSTWRLGSVLAAAASHDGTPRVRCGGSRSWVPVHVWGPWRAPGHFVFERLGCTADSCAAWEALPPMSQKRAGAVGAGLHGRIYMVGGSDGRHTLDSAEAFVVETTSWEALPAMSQRRADATIARFAGHLYVFGGSDGKQQLSSAERFQTAGDQAWDPLSPMSQPRATAAAAVLAG
ncbi:unnamed protein product, partial [Polarella glacialis]